MIASIEAPGLIERIAAHLGCDAGGSWAGNIRQQLLDFRTDVSAGDGGRVVDLIAFASGDASDAVGIVDLCAFAGEPDAGRAVVDYYFQLKRVLPRIDPVFAFPHEMADENGQTFRSLLRKLEHAAACSGQASTRLKRA